MAEILWLSLAWFVFSTFGVKGGVWLFSYLDEKLSELFYFFVFNFQ